MIKDSIEYGQFRFGTVNNDEVKKNTFKMRYKVYVKEFSFEEKKDHPNGLETDAYEDDSVHFACLNSQDSVVGTIRLVLNSEKKLPIEHVVKINCSDKIPHRQKIAEISRLTVCRDLRRRDKNDMHGIKSSPSKKEGGVLPDSQAPLPDEINDKENPMIALGLFQVMYHESKRRGITHWYMITDDRVFQILKKYGFLFQRIGEPIWYHGWRAPYLGILEEIENDLIKTNPEMLKIMLTGLEEKYCPVFAKKETV